MKTLLLILTLAFVSCEKDETRCVTCQERVHYVSNFQAQDYIKSSTEYCGDESEWKAINGQREIATGTSQGISWKRTTTMVCE